MPLGSAVAAASALTLWASLVDATAWITLRPSSIVIDVVGPTQATVEATFKGLCGQQLTNTGDSYSLDSVQGPATIYLNNTHDTAMYSEFKAQLSGSGSYSINETGWCNMVLKMTGNGAYVGGNDGMPLTHFESKDAIVTCELPQVTQINDTATGKIPQQVLASNENGEGSFLGYGTYHTDITTLNVGSIDQAKEDELGKDFVGMALEWESASAMFKKPGTSTDVNPAVKKLLSYLRRVNVNVNGNTGMLTYLPWSTLPRLDRAIYPVTQNDFGMLNNMMATGLVDLVVGAPMLSTDPRYSAEFIIEGILKYLDLDHLIAIEIGNEPDHWAIPTIAKKLFRDVPFTYPEYLAEYNAVTELTESEWPAGVRKVDFQGMAIAGCNTFKGANAVCWQDDLKSFVDDTDSQTHYVSFHRYGNSGCSKYTDASTLLGDPDWNSGDFDFLDNTGPYALSKGKALIWGEGNALSCGGKEGVSNSFAATLWMLDNLFEAAIRSVEKFNVHADPQEAYSPYIVSSSGRVTVQPVFYGMLQFRNLCETDDCTVAALKTDSKSRWIKAWGVHDKGTGAYHTVVIHKDLQTGTPLTTSVTAPNGASGAATLTRLTAPSYKSTNGIKIAGQSFDGSGDGSIKGSYQSESVSCEGGACTITVDPVSAAILTWN